MTTRVNGSPKAGIWFSADVRFLNVAVTNGGVSFVTEHDDEVVNSKLEMSLEALATRGTLIGLNVVGAAEFEVIVDYAQAYDDTAVVTEVQALIDAIADLSASAITVNSSFVGA